MSKKDEERGYVDDVVRIIKDELNLDCTISRDNPINPESVRIILSNSKISNLFNELFGTGSYRKIIPHDFLIYPVKHQLELVVGFTRGDGSYESNKKNIELTSVSESIVMSIRIFLWRNNINNSLQKIKIRNPYFNVNLNRTISPKFPTYRIVFSQGGRLASDVFGVTTGENNRKIYKKDWIKNGRVLFRVNNIEVKKNNKQKVYNLEVEEDHTYNLLQCTVHNCTIGYHFMRRGDFLHIVYYIRSCDIIRHFRDDIYMACRKVMWLLNNLKARDYENWRDVKPGYFAMHISSLHCFASERFILNQKNI